MAVVQGAQDPGGGDWWSTNLPEVTQPTPVEGASTGAGTAPGGGTPTIPPTSGGPLGLEDFRAWLKTQLQGKPTNIQTLLALQPEIEARGGHLVPNATLGPDGKPTNYDVQMPGFGMPIDVLIGASGPGGGTAWQNLDPGQGMDGGAGGSGSWLDPWTTPFKARSPEEIANDPAYQFQLQQGLQGVERSAAAKGTLLTGGTVKGLNNYAQGLASTYNDKYYNRDMGEYMLGRENFYNNQDRPFTKLSSLAQLGKPPAPG